jgi:hypothetical protein
MTAAGRHNHLTGNEMDAIFDRTGQTVAWRKADVIHRLDGKAVAFVWERTLYALTGSYLGWLEDGVYRDARGRILAFERGATGGGILPLPEPEPIKPLPELRPQLPRFAPAPRRAMRSLNWSDVKLEAVLEGVPAGG